MRTCAYAHGYPPYTFFFISILFSDVRFPLFCRFFCCLAALYGLFRCGLCCVFFGVFFWVFVCCFLIPGLYGSLFGDFGLFYGIFLMLAKMKGVSVNRCNLRMFRVWCLGYLGWNWGVVAHSGVMYPNLSYIFSLGFMRLTLPSLEKTLITLMRPDGRAARRCFAFGKTCCRSRFGAANLIL